MKKKMFTLVALMMGATAAMAQIDALPYSADFEETTAPFDAGEVVNATDVGEVLLVSNTTATANFAVNGSAEAYAIGDDEEVTVSFKAMHGWVGSSQTTTISLVNSEGVTLVGYTYNINATQVTDVVLGDKTAAGFAQFMGQANFNNNKSANGYDHSQHYVLTENYTPTVTMKVHGLGAVTFNFTYLPCKKSMLNVTYAANLSGVKMDLAKIVITDNCTNKQRSFCMDNLSITSEKKTLYKYVINYVDVETDQVVKTVEGAAEEASQVEINTDEPVWADGVKYYILDDDSDDKLVDSSNNTVVTVRCEKAPLFSYTIVATDGTNVLGTLREDAYYEDETVSYPFPRYFNVDGTLFKKDPIDQVYNGTFKLDEDNKRIEAVYAQTETANVICLLEAEDVKGLNVCNTSTVADRCSYRAGAWTSDDAKLLKLAPGTYTLIAAAYGGAYTFKAGETQVLEIASAGSWRETTSEAFTLEEAADLTFVGGSGTAGSLDYIVIQSEDGAVVNEVTRWEFTKWSEATIANLKADAAESSLVGWSDIEKKADAGEGAVAPEATADKCFWLTDAEGGELKANGEVIEELRGLDFGATYTNNRSLAIAVDYPSTSLGTYNGPQYLWLGGGGKNMVCFVIPRVKGGTEIKMGVESHKSTDARGVRLYVKAVDENGKPVISGDPLKDADGAEVALPTTYTEQSWFVPETSDIIVYNTAGCHIYYIEAMQTDEDVPTLVTEVKAQAPVCDAIFNLSGQRVSKPAKGLYIIGGKKMIVR
ncbi:MAG: hypothetical protein IJ176_02645 [Prevotella sp.]|nr:hypothetical protein [Prevotella sp.]